MCQPKSAGGFNVIDIQVWNKAAICKLLWNLCKKKDKVWVQRVQSCYIEGKKKILKAMKYVEEAGISMDELQETESLSVSSMYQKLRGSFPEVHWRKY